MRRGPTQLPSLGVTLALIGLLPSHAALTPHGALPMMRLRRPFAAITMAEQQVQVHTAAEARTYFGTSHLLPISEE